MYNFLRNFKKYTLSNKEITYLHVAYLLKNFLIDRQYFINHTKKVEKNFNHR